MSSRLDDRIRTMMQTVVDESPPPPEIPVRPPAPVPPRRVPGWVAAVGAAAAVLVLIGGVTLLLDGPSTNEVIDEPIATVATTTPTSFPDATPSTVPDLSGSGMLAVNQVSDLALAPDGAIWVATRGGVVRWDPGASVPVVYGEQDGLPAATVDQIIVAADGTVWATGRAWLAHYDGTWQPVETHSDMWFHAMAADTMGGVWVIGVWVTEEDALDLLLHIDRNGTEQISLPDRLRDWNGYDAIAVDASGRVWMVSGDGDNGVVVYDGSSWREYTTADGLPGHVLSDVDVAPDGTVWISTRTEDHGELDPGEDPNVAAAGVASFDGENWTTYTTADGLASNEGEIAIAPDGTMWVIHPVPFSPWGAVSAASRRDGDTWTVFDVAGSRQWGAAAGSDGTLWLRTNNGIAHFDGVDTTRYVVPDEMAPAAVLLTLEPTTSAATPVDAGPFGEVSWQTFGVPVGHIFYGGAVATPHGFVAGGDVSVASPDGVNWTTFEPPLKVVWNFAVSGDDLYALGDADVVRLAWTGTTWRAANVLEINGMESHRSIEHMGFGDGVTVMTNGSQIFFSTDGYTFDPALRGPEFVGDDDAVPVFFTDSKFIAFSSQCQPTIWTSTDGNTWQPVSTEPPFGSTSCIEDIAERDGRFVAIVRMHPNGGWGGETLWASEDGLAWNQVPQENIDGSMTEPVSIGAGEAGWVALFGDAGTVGGVWAMYSLDGLEWAVVADAIPDLYWAFGAPTAVVGADRILVPYYDDIRIGEITR